MQHKTKDSFWQRIRYRYRLSVLDDHTLNELWHFRLSALGLTILLTVMFLITVALLSVAIIFTPIRTILPGYNQNLRQQLMEQSERLDSLNQTFELQRQYLDVIRNITAGEIKSDSVRPLDSLQIITGEQLLATRQGATEDFIEQYEEKEKDNLLLFDVQNTTPILTIFSPVHGVITRSYAPQDGVYWIAVQTPDKENVTAVLAGTVVMVNHEADETYTIVVQHTNYLSIYRQVGDVVKATGAVVQAGETLGLVKQNTPLQFELWKDGYPVNPEEVIAF